jgi:hypothetical protein
VLDYAQARQIALMHIGPECDLIDSAEFEKPYGWYFLGQCKAYLQTGPVVKAL